MAVPHLPGEFTQDGRRAFVIGHLSRARQAFCMGGIQSGDELSIAGLRYCAGVIVVDKRLCGLNIQFSQGSPMFRGGHRYQGLCSGTDTEEATQDYPGDDNSK